MEKDEVVGMTQACQIVGMKRTSLLNRLSKKSRYYDPTLPQPFKPMQRTNKWFASELRQWVAKRAAMTRRDADGN
jgi:predicted DNA-binding transcriptional regulator AlpA